MNDADSIEHRQHLWFEQSGIVFAAPMEDLQEVVPVGHLRPIPMSEPSLAGLTTLRNEILPVFSSLALIDEKRKPAQQSSIMLVLRSPAGVAVGLLADKIGKVISLPPLSPINVQARMAEAFSGTAIVKDHPEILVLGASRIADLMGLN